VSGATTVTYHATLEHANNSTNPLPLSYTSAGNEIIYVRVQRNNTSCFSIKSFNLVVTPPPVAHQPQDFVACAIINSPTRGRFVFNDIIDSILNGQSSVFNQ